MDFIFYQEIKFRCFYIFFSLLSTFFVVLLNKTTFLFYMILPYQESIASIDQISYFFNPSDVFILLFSLSMFLSCFSIIPLVLWHGFCFFATSWYRYEQILFFFFFFWIWGTINFTSYMYFTYFLPNAWKFLIYIYLQLSSMIITVQIIPNIYLAFIFTLSFFILLFCLFQVPIIYFLLVYFGWFNFSILVQFRKIFYILNLVLATFFSSPDLLSQIFLFILLCSFYEIIILIVCVSDVLSIRIRNYV